MRNRFIKKFTVLALLILGLLLLASCEVTPTYSEHTYGEWEGDTATCTEGGVRTRTCERCPNTESEATSALGHTAGEDGKCERCGRSDFLTLIQNGKALFNVVYTSTSGGDGKRAAENFVARLRELGVTIDDPVSDTKSSNVSDCEIIIGANAKNRGSECYIFDKYLGYQGKSIKIVDGRIIIAAGTTQLTVSLFESYIEDRMGITDATESIDYLEVKNNYHYEKLTTYSVDDITIAGIDLSQYKLAVDVSGMGTYDKSEINSFHENIYNLSGYYLDTVTSSVADSYSNVFFIRYTDDAGENGFRAYYSDGNFIVECAYRNVFDETFAEFAEAIFFSCEDKIEIAEDFSYEKSVSTVRYEDFGAVGDGVTCDFNAIYSTHVFANKGGQKVIGTEGAVYYIDPVNFQKTIHIRTNVDFNGATFLINDVGTAAYSNRSCPLFTLSRDYTESSLSASKVSALMGTDELVISYGTESFDWLVGTLEAKSLVRITDSTHKDYIRHGANQNAGNSRIDIFVVDVDGTIAEDTPVAYEFDNITGVSICRVDDTPVTVENAHFQNICCRTVEKTDYKCDYAAYKRGFTINRANVTMKNITHEMLDEPEFGYYSKDSDYDPEADTIDTSKFGSRYESYPYYGFFYIYNCYNFNAVDCELTSHMTYYEDKSATVSTANIVPDPVPMGSYDLVVEYSSNITFTNVTQKCVTSLGDSSYWGIMSSNGSKNITFDTCEINRFDAHRGFWNATLINTTIGHSFNVIGGGTLYAKGVTKLHGNTFISLRSDYGASFNGNIILEDCSYPAYTTYYTTRGGVENTTSYAHAYIIYSGFATSNTGYTESTPYGGYWLWNFGYTCYMPRIVTVDNFKSDATNAYLFNSLKDIIFEKTYTDDDSITSSTVKYPYRITEQIIYKNMSKDIKVCRYTTSTYSKLNSIPITRENMGGDSEN